MNMARSLAIWLVPGLFAAMTLQAASVTIALDDGSTALADGVIVLHGKSPAVLPKPVQAAMDQRKSRFVPRVLVVPIGSDVRFPNSDNIRHQVYSFSEAKSFDLPLYSGQPANPIRLDRAGVVELGCNIHDWMQGFIVVVDSPWFGQTDATGNLTLDVPPGTYRVFAWHEWQRPEDQTTEPVIEVGAAGSRVSISLSVDRPIPTAPAVDDRLRALQEKLRAGTRD